MTASYLWTEAAPSSNQSMAEDPFALELLKNALASAADEMALTITRTARSFVVKEALDFSTALYLANGEMIAQGTCLPFHLGAMPYAVASVQRRFEERIHEGDLFITNDPYDGSTHLPDIVLVRPIFMAGELVGFSSALAHMTDIGGRIPGGNASDSTEVYQEGLRIPPSRLWHRGEPNDDLFRLIEKNVRVPDKVIGDIRSLIAACAIGEREILKLASHYGLAQFIDLCHALLDYTERFTRSEIKKLPDGEYRFKDYIDSDGIDSGRITFEVKITVKNDEMIVDFDGTSPQVRGAINCVFPFTRSASLGCIRSILDLSIPNNSGYFRPITVRAPEGTIVNPRSPAAVAARGLTGVRIGDTVFGALAKIAPQLMPACGANAPEIGVVFGAPAPDGKSYVYLEFLVGSWGGGPDRDGMDACTGTLVNYANTPVELIEADLPIAIEKYGFVTDTCGTGQWRGGMALERHLRFKVDRGLIQIRSDRRENRAYGLHGGGPGAPSTVSILRANGEEEACPAKFLASVNAGDILRVRLSGGGGYGRPDERLIADIERDLTEGKISLEHAQTAYGYTPKN